MNMKNITLLLLMSLISGGNIVASIPNAQDVQFETAQEPAASFFPCRNQQEAVRTFGELAIFTAGVALTAQGSYIAGPFVLASTTCAKYPQAVINGAENIKHKVTKEDCKRVANCCLTTCQKFTRIMSLGYYNPGSLKKAQ